jgi:hypothetical protein
MHLARCINLNMKKILNLLLIGLLMNSCGVLKKRSNTHTVTRHVDSIAVQKIVQSSVTKISGDSVVSIAAVQIENTFLINPLDTAVTIDSLENELMELYITATPGVVKDGVLTPQKIKVKAKRNGYKFYPNYNYENISTMTMDDSTVKNTSISTQTKTATKTRDTRMTAWAVILLCISVFAVGWCINTISKQFKNRII